MATNKISKTFLLFSLLFLVCFFQLHSQQDSLKIAFIADAHFADVFPDLSHEEFKSITTDRDSISILIRTMDAQVHSTRLFNENYFALKAALNDVVKRGIKIVAMPGDFSDDGQLIHLKGLRSLLTTYSDKYKLSFFIASGNHDPTEPFDKASGEKDFLGPDGRIQPVMSHEDMYNANPKKEHPTAILKGVQEGGYATILNELSDFGFFPKRAYHFWITPFAKYSYSNYSYDKAKTAAKLQNRLYSPEKEIPKIPDVSYLVEPVKGLWLLSLDANVYKYDEETDTFGGNGIGYNEILKHKKHLVDWTSHIIKEASRLEKKLIAFSHYPMLDFNDGASEEMKKVFGQQAFQAYRNPDEKVGKLFTDLGLKIHVGGHMHLNDTGIFTNDKGKTLINIQVPSLAGYPPGYKILTFTKDNKLDVKTIILDSVSDFNTFFPFYEKEHDFLTTVNANSIWDKTILSNISYSEYIQHHLKELIRLRLLSKDFPEELRKILSVLNGWELFVLSCLESLDSNFVKEDANTIFKNKKISSANWTKASEKALTKLKKSALTQKDYENWLGTDLILDFYKLRNADQVALQNIPAKRIEAYKFLYATLSRSSSKDTISAIFKDFMTIMMKQLSGDPSIHFEIDMDTGKVVEK